jgi:flagellin-like hook-associated protein FlgL
VSVSALQDAGGILSKAREIALEGAQSGNDAASYEALAQQVDALINRLLDAGNTQNGGRYIFAGTATNVAPFRVQSTNAAGQPQSVVYQGGTDPVREVVGATRTMATLAPGDAMFQSRQRAATVYSTTTGAIAGTPVDSATGQGTLTVMHTLTTYASGSGVAAGISSPSGDTIIGPTGEHRLTINDTSGTGASGFVSLDGGPQIPFTSSDTNLKLSGPTGDVVYIDTTAIAPGFSGDVDITAGGTLSVDGGATQVAIDFSTNQVVTDGASGAVTNVNSSAIRRAGTDQTDYTGTYDAFQILIALRDDLRNARGQTSSAQIQSISRRVGELERVHAGILDAVGEQSVSLENLDALEQRIKDVQLEVQKQSADLESVDLSSAVLELQNEETLLKLTYAAASTVFDQSLLDFLR